MYGTNSCQASRPSAVATALIVSSLTSLTPPRIRPADPTLTPGIFANSCCVAGRCLCSINDLMFVASAVLTSLSVMLAR